MLGPEVGPVRREAAPFDRTGAKAFEKSDTAMRHFIRYAVDIPIEVTFKNRGTSKTERVKNVSIGGLCVTMDDCPGIGTQLLIRIPHLEPPFETGVEVVWCLRKEDQYDVGLRLLDPQDAFMVRMVEQICHIEHFRNEALAVEGRKLTAEQAAMEWIDKHSSSFPRLEHCPPSIRSLIRHPTDIRIERVLLGSGNTYVAEAQDIGLGGLRLFFPVRAEPGTEIGIRVLYVEPPFEGSGQVAWCSRIRDHYDVGIELTSWQEEDWLGAVEQILEIERYRKEVERENACHLSVAQAAELWYTRKSNSS